MIHQEIICPVWESVTPNGDLTIIALDANGIHFAPKLYSHCSRKIQELSVQKKCLLMDLSAYGFCKVNEWCLN